MRFCRCLFFPVPALITSKKIHFDVFEGSRYAGVMFFQSVYFVGSRQVQVLHISMDKHCFFFTGVRSDGRGCIRTTIQQQYNNALFALTTKGHIYIASDKNYSNLRNTYALSRTRTIKEPCGFRVTPLPFSCKTK